MTVDRRRRPYGASPGPGDGQSDTKAWWRSPDAVQTLTDGRLLEPQLPLIRLIRLEDQHDDDAHPSKKDGADPSECTRFFL